MNKYIQSRTSVYKYKLLWTSINSHVLSLQAIQKLADHLFHAGRVWAYKKILILRARIRISLLMLLVSLPQACVHHVVLHKILHGKAYQQNILRKIKYILVYTLTYSYILHCTRYILPMFQAKSQWKSKVPVKVPVHMTPFSSSHDTFLQFTWHLSPVHMTPFSTV